MTTHHKAALTTVGFILVSLILIRYSAGSTTATARQIPVSRDIIRPEELSHKPYYKEVEFKNRKARRKQERMDRKKS